MGRPGAPTRSGSTMIGNSIAVSRCEKGRWSIEYFWGHRNSGAPAPFFDSKSADFKYWPLDGFVMDGKLYAALLRVHISSPAVPFGFEMKGVTLARIDNPRRNPLRWTIRYQPLSEGDRAVPGVSAVVRGSFVYLYAMADRENHQTHSMLLSRIPLKSLDAPARVLAYRIKGNKWERGPDKSGAAAVVLKRGAPEMSFRYHTDLKKWVAVQNSPEFASAPILARTAPAPAGPWSAGRPVFQIPEISSGRSLGVFCYAAKEHAEFRRPSGETLITYVCNTLDPENLTRRMDLYRPRVALVRVR